MKSNREKAQKLTNRDISTNYKDTTFYLMRSDFLGEFAKWVVIQSPYDTPDITPALKEFAAFVAKRIPEGGVKQFSFQQIMDFASEKTLTSLPEVEKLNHRKNGRDGMGFRSRYEKPYPDDDFIDLGALARNVAYGIMRDQITTGDVSQQEQKMDNRKKAQRIVKAIIANQDEDSLLQSIEAELNRLDNPEPKKWEPRGGEHYVASDNMIRQGVPNESCRIAGREYPTLEEIKRAAPLHRKMDRLVNWIVEHVPIEDWRLSTADVLATPSGKILVVFDDLEEIGNQLVQAINSGEVEL